MAPAEGSERTELCRKADIALYHAKATGRSRYAVFNSGMDAIQQTRRALEIDLRQALEDHSQIQVHYQPLFSAGERKITGVEALLRWRHPSNGWISPDVFIPIAEETGLIERLGELVLREACVAANKWPLATVAINVSAVELRNPAYALKVAEALMTSGIPASKLELELTESVVTDSAGQCALNIRTLRDLGVRIAIDDFGTGFSSLSRLQELKVDRIKIDRSFVNGFGSSNGDEAIVQAIINLAHATGLKTTAEGVETDAQSRNLEAMGCDELQGFLLARPVAASEIDELFAVAMTRAIGAP
jgi:EAL domain-containing protein (putative c-di-GMP-specific phosphodiesterase class I)